MSDPLGRIERQLISASRRRGAQLRARRRFALLVAITTATLFAASVASAVTGVGPLGSIFDDDRFAPSYAKPQPGGARTLLAAGSGERRFEVLTYQTRSSLTGQRGLKDYCVALATPRAARLADGALPPRRDPDSVSCEYAPTYAAKILQRRFVLGEGEIAVGGRPEPKQLPVFGVTLASVRSVSAKQGNDDPVGAKLSPPFTIEVPNPPQRVRDQIENPNQQRATRNLPRSIRVRAFLVVLERKPPPTQLDVAVRFDDGQIRTQRRRLGVPQEPKP